MTAWLPSHLIRTKTRTHHRHNTGAHIRKGGGEDTREAACAQESALCVCVWGGGGGGDHAVTADGLQSCWLFRMEVQPPQKTNSTAVQQQ